MVVRSGFVFVLMIREPPRPTRTDTRCPYTALVRSRRHPRAGQRGEPRRSVLLQRSRRPGGHHGPGGAPQGRPGPGPALLRDLLRQPALRSRPRSEEHTSELQSLMRISYAVFCLKKKNTDYSTETKNEAYTIR